MKQVQKLFLAGIICCGLSALPLFASATSPSVYVSEVAWAGSSLSSSDEFIELYNPTGETVSLSGWSLSGAATKGETLLLPDDAEILPNSTYLIANYDAQDENSTLAIEPNFATSTLSLPNTKLSVALLDDGGAQVDSVGDGTGQPAFGGAGSAEAGTQHRSMTRVAPDLLGSLDEAWADTNTSYGLEAFVQDFGTPGVHVTLTPAISTAPENQPSISPSSADIVQVTDEASAQEAVQVYPATYGSNQGIITVIFQGYTFELNLPNEIQMSAFVEEDVIKSEAETVAETQLANETVTTATPVEISSALIEAAVTDDVETVVEPPTEEVAGLIEETFEAAAETAETVDETHITTLRFSELYPNTTGNDEEEEYIEVENYGTEIINLLGWSITDASGKTWTADGSYELNHGEAVALSRVLTKITLNNTTETVTLKSPSGDVVDSVTYAGSTKGSTYTKTSDGWSWMNPTPNTVETTEVVEAADVAVEVTEQLVVPNVVVDQEENNAVSEPVMQEPATEPIEIVLTQETQNLSEVEQTSSNENTAPSFPIMTIAEARTKAMDTRVTVEGYVSVLPNTLATQFFYIENGDGIQVYMYKADFPMLAVGNLVRVRGTISQNRGELRVKTSNLEDITVLDTSTTLTASYVLLESIGEAYEGKLVMVEGTVEAARSTDLALIKDTATLEVVARSKTGVSFADISSGDRVQITGIVSEYDGAYRVLPRSQDDIVVMESAENTALAGTTNSSNTTAGFYGALLLLAALGATGVWFVRSKHNQDLTLTKV